MLNTSDAFSSSKQLDISCWRCELVTNDCTLNIYQSIEKDRQILLVGLSTRQHKYCHIEQDGKY